MSSLLALEWDSREARVAIARRRGREALVEDAFTIDLEPRAGAAALGPAEIGSRIGAELAARNLTRVETLVAVGRKDIELRLLSVPPAPPEELPDVVRFQAMRQFTTLGEDWPLDFLPLDAGDMAPSSVLAAALSTDHIKQIRAACEAAGLAPRRVVLRPMAAASLLTRQLPDTSGRCRMMVDLMSEEADFTVLVGERVVFLRTVRLPVHDAAETQHPVLVSELRRTMVAAQNQLGGKRVEYVIVCGDPGDQQGLVERLKRDLSLSVESFDPFAALALDDALRHRLPDRHGRFAPLLGMLVDEASGSGHAIDFLNPRKRPAAPDRRRRRLMWAAGAGLVAAGLAGVLVTRVALLDHQISSTSTRLTDLKPAVEQAQQKIKEAGEVDKFAHGDITWLDEMYRLSDEKHFPGGEDAILLQLVGASREPSGGNLFLDGLVRDAAVINTLETSLRDERHAIVGTGGQSDTRMPKYPWKFKETVVIAHPEAPPPAKKPAAASRRASPAPGSSAAGAGEAL